MRLRKLNTKDAPLMLEWMHDFSVVEFLHADFMKKTIGDCEQFVKRAQDESTDIHLAIVDDMDTYMGTVSLKYIRNQCAEFAIAIRKCAMGKGYAQYAMSEVFRFGWDKIGLTKIYWCVDPENKRAVRFYDKNRYTRVTSEQIVNVANHYPKDQIARYIWYCEYKY